ncbi:MAG TPA: biopolymer transporter ExbD [Planctomycetaceae bacterium]|jgi:biopolymer transport protein ExbD|nr:biopolymer transporter ExbD [Planctomycetaceae bacterium]
MKLKKASGGPAKIPIDMTPMIDCVFQLIIFFMLTLKIRANEGDFNINMPLGQGVGQSSELPPIKVRLEARQDGTLRNISIGQRSLGDGPRAFALLNQEVLNLVGRPGAAFSKEIEVELDADYELHYQDVVSAMSACTGKVDEKTGNPVRFVEKIKFSPPRPKKGG